MTKFNKEDLHQIFLEKYDQIPKFKLYKIGYLDTAKQAIGNVVLSDKYEHFHNAYVKTYKALVINDLEKGKIINMHPNQLFNYIETALNTLAKDYKRKEELPLKAVVIETGFLLPGFQFIKRNRSYKKKDILQLESYQKLQKVEVVKYYLRSIGQIEVAPTHDGKTGEEIIGDEVVETYESKRLFNEQEEKNLNIEELLHNISKLSSKCRDLINEWRKRDREDRKFSFKIWSLEKEMNLDTLKGQYKRCIDSLIAMYPKRVI